MSEDYDFLHAPFSSEQVDALNRFQRRGDVHEFTCPEDHGGADRTLIATTQGWICPHCAYTQDWAHRAMLTNESWYKLPCDVMVPPATLIRKGCGLDTLMVALKARDGRPPEDCRFNDPANRPLFAALSGQHPIKVRASDYNYEGTLAAVVVKRSGAIRYVVEDQNRRLFIHNHIQIGVDEGWTPPNS